MFDVLCLFLNLLLLLLFLNMKLWLVDFMIEEVMVMLCMLINELFFYEEVGLEKVWFMKLLFFFENFLYNFGSLIIV